MVILTNTSISELTNQLVYNTLANIWQCNNNNNCCLLEGKQLQQNLERAREKAVLIVDEEPPFSLEATRIHIAGVHPTSVSYVVKLGEHAGCNFPTKVYNFIWLRFQPHCTDRYVQHTCKDDDIGKSDIHRRYVYTIEDFCNHKVSGLGKF